MKDPRGGLGHLGQHGRQGGRDGAGHAPATAAPAGGLGEELVHASRGDARHLARSLRGAPEAVADQARMAAQHLHGNQFVAELAAHARASEGGAEATVEAGTEAAGDAGGADQQCALAQVGTISGQLHRLHELQQALVERNEHAFAAQLGALGAQASSIAAGIASGATSHATWSQVADVLTVVLQVIMAVIEVAAAVLTAGAGAALVVGAVAACVGAVATIASNLPALLAAVGAPGAGQAVGDWSRANPWFTSTLGAIAAVAALTTTISGAGAGGAMVGGAISLGGAIATYAADRAAGEGKQIVDQGRGEADRVGDAVGMVTQSLGGLAAEEQRAQDAAPGVADAAVHGAAAGLQVVMNIDAAVSDWTNPGDSSTGGGPSGPDVADMLAGARAGVVGAADALIGDAGAAVDVIGGKFQQGLTDLGTRARDAAAATTSAAVLDSIATAVAIGRSIARTAAGAGALLGAVEAAVGAAFETAATWLGSAGTASGDAGKEAAASAVAALQTAQKAADTAASPSSVGDAVGGAVAGATSDAQQGASNVANWVSDNVPHW